MEEHNTPCKICPECEGLGKVNCTCGYASKYISKQDIIWDTNCDKCSGQGYFKCIRCHGSGAVQRCTCDEVCDDPCPAHGRENYLQNCVLELEADLVAASHDIEVYEHQLKQKTNKMYQVDIYKRIVMRRGVFDCDDPVLAVSARLPFVPFPGLIIKVPKEPDALLVELEHDVEIQYDVSTNTFSCYLVEGSFCRWDPNKTDELIELIKTECLFKGWELHRAGWLKMAASNEGNRDEKKSE